jgi:glycosyltransferase involved in cell wall biosynthesis
MMKYSLPLFPDVGVLALPYQRWGWHWMTPHHVLTRLAQYFQVVWVNPAHERHDLWRQKVYASIQRTNEISSPGFQIYTPELWLPKLYRPKWLAQFTFEQRLRRAQRLLIRRGCQKTILYLWFPDFGPALHSIPFDLSCYHIEDEYSFSPVERPVSETERRLIAAVDQVFVVSPGLFEKKGKINPHTVIVPHGVDYRAYATPLAEPGDLTPIPHPRIGYTGFLKRQLDWALLVQLAQQRPEWSFVFVGPQAPHREVTDAIRTLARLSNVYFLGAKTTHDLTAYPQHFDVCIMPYVLNDYTKYIYPLKLQEYLASGRPVVGSPIRSLQEFAHVLTLARTTDEWLQALRDSLAPHSYSAEQIEARRRVACEYDWEQVVQNIARVLCLRLGAVYMDQIEKLPPNFREISAHEIRAC